MLHTNNPIIKHKAGLLNLAEELGNVSKACKKYAVEFPAHGQHRTSNELRKLPIAMNIKEVSMYNLLTLRRDIESLGTKSRENPFVWEEQNGIVDEELTNQFHNGRRRKNYINDLAEYCWFVYKKAFISTGPMLIGRSGDLWKKSVLAQFNLNKGEYLWKKNTTGNILMMDKWAAILNDAWVLGGVHRHANFHLMSLLAPENLWNYQSGYHIVTAREIFGLQKFGYERVVIGKKVIFKCKDISSADNANLRSYSLLMKTELSQRESSINKLILEPVAGLNKDIQNFDYSRLKRQWY